MSKKVKNLMKMWREAGYDADVMEWVKKGNKFYHLEVDLYRLDGKSISFESEWEAMKELASRQKFTLIAVREKDEFNASTVLFVDSEMLNNTNKELNRLLVKLQQEFWYLQKDDEVVRLWDQAKLVRESCNSLITYSRTLPGKSFHLLKGFTLQFDYYELSERMVHLQSKLNECEKLNIELDRKLIDIYNSIGEKHS